MLVLYIGHLVWHFVCGMFGVSGIYALITLERNYILAKTWESIFYTCDYFSYKDSMHEAFSLKYFVHVGHCVKTEL